MSDHALLFPEGFLWGTATSAHQVEGGNTDNDWWAWEQAGGHIRGGDRSGMACDWWHRAEEDFDRAQQLGLSGQRLSIEWSRLEPRPGEWNGAAFARYRQMLAGLRARGIQPMVTLQHFTLPTWIADSGGWESPSTITYYSRYVERVVAELGDLVSLWCTINEPAAYAFGAYWDGRLSPGKHSLSLAFKVLRHLLLAHGEAYRVLHALQGEAQVGLSNNLIAAEPANAASPLDRALTQFADRGYNVAAMDAVVEGRFKLPLGWGRVPKLTDSIDYVGVDYYTRYVFGVGGREAGGTLAPRFTAGAEISDLGFSEPYPVGLYHALKRVQRYGKPIFVTENGLPDADDDMRPRFILSHLAQLWRAIQEGVPVRGYYHWSLVDNFEWGEGFAMRFGLIEVDFATQARRIRNSGRLYGEICQANAITEDLVQRYAPQAMEAVFG